MDKTRKGDNNNTTKRCNRPDSSSRNKGIAKKRKTFFQKGNTSQRRLKRTDTIEQEDISVPVKRPCKRHDEDYFKLFVKETAANKLGIPGPDGKDGSAIVLRPTPIANTEEAAPPQKSPKGIYNMKEGNFVAEKSRILQLFNHASKEHKELGKCDEVDCWDFIDIEPWGVYCSVVITCTHCGYKSDPTRLYEELDSGKRGRKAAVGNVRLQLMLQDTPIGPTEAQLLFAAVGLNAGCLSSMQRGAYKAAQATEDITHMDMIKWRTTIQDVLKDRGVLCFNHISGGFDVRYNGSSMSSSVTPGPGATQGVGLFTENITSQQKCLGLDYQNILCPSGARLRARGVDIVCGEGPMEDRHPGCTSTLPPGRHISEYKAAENIADDLHDESGISVTHLVTDSDGTGREAFKSVNKQNDTTLPDITWYKDLMHVGWNMKQKIKAHKFSTEAFGLKLNGDSWNYKERMECVKALATDVQERTAITLKKAVTYFNGDVSKLQKNSEKITQYMIKCYQGNHKSCTSAPIAKLTGCNGDYFSSSSSLKAQQITALNLDMTDKCFLESVIGMKLGKDSVHFFSRRLTTSRCESMNRAISKSAPKNRVFVRTGKGRVSSAVLRQNNSFKESVRKKFEAMNCPMQPGEVCDKVINRYQRKRNLTYRNQQKPSSLARRRTRQEQRRADYFHQRTRVSNEGEYIKNQLDKAYAAKDSGVAKLASHTETDEAVTLASLEADVRNAAVRVRRTKCAIKEWNDYQLASIEKKEEEIEQKKTTNTKKKKSAKIRCANKTAARKVRDDKHGDHSYGK